MGCKECCCSINFRIAIAAIGVFVGILAGVWFAGDPDFQNYNSSAFGFVSSILALITLIVHIKYKRHTLDGWVSKKVLVAFMIIGCIFQVIAIAAFITYVVLAIVYHQGLSTAEDLHGENYWIALVWAWMTWKWGFALFWFSRMYRKEYLQERLGCVEEGKLPRQHNENVNVSADGESRE